VRRGRGYGPSIVDGRIRYVSVSQLEKFDAESYAGCPRRWWFSYVAGKPEPEIKAQRLGKQVHSQLEHYLLTGENVLGPLTLAGFRFLPKPKMVEVELSIATFDDGQIVSGLDCADIPVVGYVDCVNASGASENDAGESVLEPDVVEAIDWKTTKRIDDEVDPDTGIVVKKGLAKTAEELSRTHQMVGYGEWLRRRHPSAQAIRLSHGVFQTQGARVAVKRSALVTVEEVRERWRRSEKVAESMKAAARVEDVAKLPANLSACSAYGGCPFRRDCPRETISILASLFGKGKAMSLLDKINARKNGTPAPVVMTPPPPATPDPAEVAAETAKLATEEAAMRTASVVPPDAPTPTPPTLAAVEVTKLESVEPVKKTRKVKDAQLTQAGLTLYLDCHEDGVATKRLEAYAQTLADELARAAGAADIRCAPEKSELSFGKWKGALAAVARATPPEPGAYAVNMSNEIVAVVAEALAPTAARVVRGRP
jgi:hypothetical protein